MISKNQIKYVRQLEQKKFRKAENLFIAEGHKVVGDLLAAGFRPHQLFATQEWLESNTPLLRGGGARGGGDIIEVTTDELTKLSLQQHSQQVLALFPIPKAQPQISNLRSALPLGIAKKSPLGSAAWQRQEISILLDNVQDPGNLGTIIRVSDWFGIDTIFCSPGTVDAWNPKVVQATMGSIARVNIVYIEPDELFDALPADFPIYGTFLDGQNIYTQQLSSHGLIVMGNEGNGISDAVRARVTHKLLIPDFHQGDTADSLNVAIATAITCSEFRRRGL